MTSRAEQLDSLRSLVEAFNKHDVAACAAHLAADASWERGDGSTVQGREALEAGLRGFFAGFPDATLTPVEMLALEPEGALVEWVLEATHRGGLRLPGLERPLAPTGRVVRVVGAHLIGFNGSGAIEQLEARIDIAGLLGQLGIVRDAAPAAAGLQELAERYTAAWCSQDAASVASFYSEDGSLSVNGGAPAVGREAITEVAQGFMTAFPDMKVLLDGLFVQNDRAVYRWTLIGTNSGPGGTGRPVRISGFEVWQLGSDGLIARSRGYFDSAAYLRQLEVGAWAAP